MKYIKNYLTLIMIGVFTASCASVTSNQSVLPQKSHVMVSKQKNTITSLPSEHKDKLSIAAPLPQTRTDDDLSFDTDYIGLGDRESTISKNGPFLDDALDLCETAQNFWQKGELENALDALDQAYDLIIKVDTEDKPILTQQKDDLRFMISKRILEIYASRNIVINGNYNEIPLTLNEHVQYEIDLLTTGGEKNFFADSSVEKRARSHKKYTEATPLSDKN